MNKYFLYSLDNRLCCEGILVIDKIGRDKRLEEELLLLGKTHKTGRSIEELAVGEKMVLTEKIEDKDLLLYLGLTNDNNPLYIQHDFAAKTSYMKPIVPSIMLLGVITASISKYLPGPGSHVIRQEVAFPKPTFHYALLTFTIEIKDIDLHKNEITLLAIAKDEQGDNVLEGLFYVNPPKLI